MGATRTHVITVVDAADIEWDVTVVHYAPVNATRETPPEDERVEWVSGHIRGSELPMLECVFEIACGSVDVAQRKLFDASRDAYWDGCDE